MAIGMVWHVNCELLLPPSPPHCVLKAATGFGFTGPFKWQRIVRVQIATGIAVGECDAGQIYGEWLSIIHLFTHTHTGRMMIMTINVFGQISLTHWSSLASVNIVAKVG